MIVMIKEYIDFKLKCVKATENAINIKEREEFKAAYEEAKNLADLIMRVML